MRSIASCLLPPWAAGCGRSTSRQRPSHDLICHLNSRASARGGQSRITIMTSFQLTPGVVIDTDRNEAYLMSPEGGIVALDIASGTRVWRSDAAAKPLAKAGDLLVGQAEPAASDSKLTIVALHAGKNGEPVIQSHVELPPGVRPQLQQTLN